MNLVKNKKVFSRRKGRKITVNSVLWKWSVGESGYVLAYSETGKRLLVRANKVTGRDFERGQWKRTSDGMVTPADIARWISSQTT